MLTPALLLRTGITLFARTPAPLQRALAEAAVNHALRIPLRENAFGWLAGRWLGVSVAGTGLTLRFTLAGTQLSCETGTDRADVIIQGEPQALLLLAAGHEDADTLFFQRQLRISGDTELGVAVKNTLDAYGPAALPAILRNILGFLAHRNRIVAH